MTNMITEVKRVCPQCGRVLEEGFVVCPYCGKSLTYVPAPVEPKKGRKVAKWIAGVILGVILLFAFLSVLSYFGTPALKIELVEQDATFTDDGLHMELTVTLENTGSVDANVEVKFKTTWDEMSDTETKDIVIPTQQSRTVSATLDANPNPELTTYYTINWFPQAIE